MANPRDEVSNSEHNFDTTFSLDENWWMDTVDEEWDQAWTSSMLDPGGGNLTEAIDEGSQDLPDFGDLELLTNTALPIDNLFTQVNAFEDTSNLYSPNLPNNSPHQFPHLPAFDDYSWNASNINLGNALPDSYPYDFLADIPDPNLILPPIPDPNIMLPPFPDNYYYHDPASNISPNFLQNNFSETCLTNENHPNHPSSSTMSEPNSVSNISSSQTSQTSSTTSPQTSQTTSFSTSNTPSSEQSTSSENSFTCTTCSKTFPQRYLLNKHTPIHTRPHICPYTPCTHSAARRRDMNRHILARHRDQLRKQNINQNQNQNQNQLRNQGLLEEEESKPKCPIPGCGREFARKDGVSRHLKRKHGG